MSQLSLYVNDRGRCVMHYSGFSWLAGIALAVWALQRRLYLVAGIALVYGIVYNVFIIQFNGTVQVLAWVIQFAVIGALANRLHRVLLERQGWLLTEQERATPGDKAS